MASPFLPILGSVRFARVDDIPHIEGLLNESMTMTFRIHCADDIYELITNGVLSITQLDINERIVGFIAAMDFPRIPSVHPAAWEHYIWARYKAIELKARNTLFIHLLVWNQRFGRDCVDNMLKSMFMHDPHLHYIAMVKSLVEYPWLIPGYFRAEGSFRRVPAADKTSNPDKLPALFIADRITVSPRLRIRRAVEEDNDDIVPIIDNQAERLREMYGDFYISELISRHPDSERVLLVCEHKEVAVGVMCLNTQINYEDLEESFILAPFGGLRHVSCEESILSRGMDNINQSMLSMKSTATDYKMVCKNRRDDEELRDIRFGSPTSKVSLISRDTNLEGMPEETLVSCDHFDLHLEDYDEEELDYDIVNIDKELLIVPEMLQYQNYSGNLRKTTEFVPFKQSNIQKIIEETKKLPKIEDKLKKLKPKSSSSTVRDVKNFQREPVKRYIGEPNAFLIEIFAMHPEYDERYGFDMLEVAFEIFPNRDYCILCLPSNHPVFPLLEHFTLVVPNNRTSKEKYITESLYVAHVNSVRGMLRVRPGEEADIVHLIDVLEHVRNEDAFLKLYRSTLYLHELQSFVVLSENQPVGVVMLGPLEDEEAVRNQYDLEPESREAGTDGVILQGVITSILLPHVRWILRELIRQSSYCTIFWTCKLFARGEESPQHNLTSLAGHMCPVHPRQSVHTLIDGHSDARFKNLGTPFALWMVERPLTSMPRVNVNSSIVVVGASCTGLSFLESLIMGPTSQYLTFSNLTLVSENGLPTFADCLKAAAICVPRSGRYTDRYLKSVPFYYYVDVISNVMTKIDRKRKCIHFKCGDIKYYDILVLACGKQFQHPEYLKDSLELVKEVHYLEPPLFRKGQHCERLLMDNPSYRPDRMPPDPKLPYNVMLINSLFEANICLRKLLRMIADNRNDDNRLSNTNQVVVYGDYIEAYSCMAALLELGLAAESIVFVEPFPSENRTKMRVNSFNNETVDERVQQSINNTGIRVIRYGHLAGWSVVDNTVQSLNIMTKLHHIELKCFALFYYGLQAINLYAFRAINECGLVYDGGIVVNPTFETNDHNIFAAGPCVRYSRRLYAFKRLHANYCSEDTGEALARLFLIKLDPFIMTNSDLDLPSDLLPTFSSISHLGYSSSLLPGSFSSTHVASMMLSISSGNRRWQPVIKFESPIIQSATLPGPLYYMKVRKPGKEMPQAIHEVLPTQGHTLTTDDQGNLFTLQLNALHVIDTVVCLSHKLFSDVMSQLFGKHEAFFDKLLDRYQKNEIKDFYTYFTQPWMAVLYQETFKDLLADIYEQDIGTVSDLAKSRYTPYLQEISRSKSLQGRRSSVKVFTYEPSIVSLFSMFESHRDLINPHTFRSLIRNIFTSKSDLSYLGHAMTCVPSECGQPERVRSEVSTLWKRVDGERIVASHLTTYLNNNPVHNPQYALTKLEFT